jgi:hypothetical protein
MGMGRVPKILEKIPAIKLQNKNIELQILKPLKITAYV